MATYTSVSKWADAQRKKLTELEKAHGRVVGTVHAQQIVRIYEEGKRGSGGGIGQYNSTTPLYVNPKLAKNGAKLTKKGKTGQTKFKNGKPHKSAYFPSYKAFRGSQGLETGFVNLDLTGQLKLDHSNSLQPQGDTWIAGTKNPANTKKLNGAIDKYGVDVFKISQDERKLLIDTLRKEREAIGI